jgi:hAT family C-terminal dimerisation region
MGNDFLASRNPLYLCSAASLHQNDHEVFPKSYLKAEVCSSMNPCHWWSCVSSQVRLPVGLVNVAKQLMCLPSSTAGIERNFSVMGKILSKSRNRVGVEKSSKLCYVYNYLHLQNKSDVYYDSDNLD